MSAIFLSYRRRDAQGTTGRIFNWLEKHYGADEVFMDADDIPLGVDFRRHIEGHIERAEVLLAVIGPKWNELGENGRRRLSSKSDMVRTEILLALESGVAVVPLFVDGADVPIPSSLPKALRDLSFHQAEHIDSGRDFRSHIKRLVGRLDALIEQRHADRLKALKAANAVKAPPATTPTPPKPPASKPSSPATTPPCEAITKPAKPASRETENCVVSVAADLASQLTTIGREKG